MSRSKRLEKRDLRLAQARDEFEALLRACLPEAARGRLGLFDQYDTVHTAAHKLPHDRHMKRMNRINAALNLLEEEIEEPRPVQIHAKSENRGWPEADHLRELAAEVVALQGLAGETEPWLPLDAYLRACSVKGKNAPGEPRLAVLLQQELKAGSGEAG
ncbi:MAG TPA: hypothetical protein VM554_07175 [Acidisarcina sp.]|nr:hypothetical protein [Acidisarcina sp.]